MRVHAVINRRSGSVLDIGEEILASQVKEAFQQRGHTILVEIAGPAEIDERLNSAVVGKPDIILIGGGDGTVRSAAKHVLGTDIILGILPLGTVNRLARDLKIPLLPVAAAAALAAGESCKIDVATANGQIFLCNSLLGLPPEISEERQKLRGAMLLPRVAGYFRLLGTILATRSKIELSIDHGSIRSRMRVLSLAVSNNPYSEERSLVLTRGSLDSGKLGLYIAKHRNGYQLLWVLLRAGLGWWDGDPNLDRMTAKYIVINSKRKHLRLSNDGEVEKFDTPLHYSILPKALTVLVPAIVPR